jgi:hypothetical protein
VTGQLKKQMSGMQQIVTMYLSVTTAERNAR